MTLRWPTALLAALLLPLGPAPVLGVAECQVVTDFSQNSPGEYPEDWTPRHKKARDVYRVYQEGSDRFVRGTAEGSGLQIGKSFDWDLATHPILRWRWRPRLFPPGSDERRSGRNDSALGVYAVFPHSPVSARTLKYVWSHSAPPQATASASKGLTRMLVLRSGEPPGSGWAQETANVAADYERLVGERPKRPRGIAILTDADDTKSRAIGDYADFAVCAPTAMPRATPAPPAPTPP